MVFETTTTLSGQDVIARAKKFFAERLPQYAAYPEKEGPAYLVLRGQGGEEIALAILSSDAGVRVRASTLLFDQQVDRFLATLPEAEVAA